jgi:predicted HTH transcriptional regulator
MKTCVSESSIVNFYDPANKRRFGQQEQKILAVMQHGRVYTRREVAVLAGVETSSTSGRINALIHAGVIEVIGSKQCSVSHKHVEAIALVPVQMEMAA